MECGADLIPAYQSIKYRLSSLLFFFFRKTGSRLAGPGPQWASAKGFISSSNITESNKMFITAIK